MLAIWITKCEKFILILKPRIIEVLVLLMHFFILDVDTTRFGLWWFANKAVIGFRVFFLY